MYLSVEREKSANPDLWYPNPQTLAISVHFTFDFLCSPKITNNDSARLMRSNWQHPKSMGCHPESPSQSMGRWELQIATSSWRRALSVAVLFNWKSQCHQLQQCMQQSRAIWSVQYKYIQWKNSHFLQDNPQWQPNLPIQSAASGYCTWHAWMCPPVPPAVCWLKGSTSMLTLRGLRISQLWNSDVHHSSVWVEFWNSDLLSSEVITDSTGYSRSQQYSDVDCYPLLLL